MGDQSQSKIEMSKVKYLERAEDVSPIPSAHGVIKDAGGSV